MRLITLLIAIYLTFIFSFAKDEQKNVETSIDRFLDQVCRNYPMDIWSKYLSKDYIVLGGEFEAARYYIINDYSIDSVLISGDMATVSVKINSILRIESTKLTHENINSKKYSTEELIAKEYVFKGDTIILSFILKKEDSKWKISAQTNRSFDFLGNDVILYMNSALEYFYPNRYMIDKKRKKELNTIYEGLLNFYHNNFLYSLKYLKKLNKRELRILRNEIFAHYGRIFKTSWLNEYFKTKSWYQPNPDYTDSLLTENDLKNIKRILKIEKKFSEHKY